MITNIGKKGGGGGGSGFNFPAEKIFLSKNNLESSGYHNLSKSDLVSDLNDAPILHSIYKTTDAEVIENDNVFPLSSVKSGNVFQQLEVFEDYIFLQDTQNFYLVKKDGSEHFLVMPYVDNFQKVSTALKISEEVYRWCMYSSKDDLKLYFFDFNIKTKEITTDYLNMSELNLGDKYTSNRTFTYTKNHVTFWCGEKSQYFCKIPLLTYNDKNTHIVSDIVGKVFDISEQNGLNIETQNGFFLRYTSVGEYRYIVYDNIINCNSIGSVSSSANEIFVFNSNNNEYISCRYDKDFITKIEENKLEKINIQNKKTNTFIIDFDENLNYFVTCEFSSGKFLIDEIYQKNELKYTSEYKIFNSPAYVNSIINFKKSYTGLNYSTKFLDLINTNLTDKDLFTVPKIESPNLEEKYWIKLE